MKEGGPAQTGPFSFVKNCIRTMAKRRLNRRANSMIAEGTGSMLNPYFQQARMIAQDCAGDRA
jgi:hypothetical protein